SRTLIEASDPRLQPIKLDITNEADVAAAAEACQDVTILMNNAGVATPAPLLTAPLVDGARQDMETNYFGTLAMVRAFAPILGKNGGGTLVTCSPSSVGSPHPFPRPIVRPSMRNCH